MKKILGFANFVTFLFCLFLANSCEKDDEKDPVPSDVVADSDGNVYRTVTVGDQVWLAENLKTTKYNDGTDIPLVTDNNEWKALTTAAFCWYNNDEATYGGTYGVIYNWYAVDAGNLCPAGWHIPDFYEWNELLDNLGGTSSAGGKLKEQGTVHWNSPNTGATNASGFTALPGGVRSGPVGSFDGNGNFSVWWSSSGNWYYEDAWSILITQSDSIVNMRQLNWNTGCCIRCVKD